VCEPSVQKDFSSLHQPARQRDSPLETPPFRTPLPHDVYGSTPQTLHISYAPSHSIRRHRLRFLCREDRQLCFPRIDRLGLAHAVAKRAHIGQDKLETSSVADIKRTFGSIKAWRENVVPQQQPSFPQKVRNSGPPNSSNEIFGVSTAPQLGLCSCSLRALSSRTPGWPPRFSSREVITEVHFLFFFSVRRRAKSHQWRASGLPSCLAASCYVRPQGADARIRQNGTHLRVNRDVQKSGPWDRHRSISLP